MARLTRTRINNRDYMSFPLRIGDHGSSLSSRHQHVREQIEQLAALHQADEIMAVTNMYYLEDRKRSFELLKLAFS